MHKPNNWIKAAVNTFADMLKECDASWAFMGICEGHELSTDEQYELAAAIQAAGLPMPDADTIRRGYC